MSEETLTGAATLMLAQAAECFYEKANDEKSSSPVTALVAVYSADLYDVAYRSFKTGVDAHPPPSTVKAKALLFSAIAHFHTGPVTSSERVVGERIARLSVAQELVGEAYRHAQDVGGILREITKGYVDVIENACMMVEAANHNQLHETPYDLRLLSPLKRPPQALVHPSPVHEAIPNPGKYKDPFHPLLAPNHREDVRHVMEESRRVAHAGQTKLHACVKSIDEFTKKHGLSLPHPVGVAIPNPGLSAQNPDDLRAHAQQFLKRLHDLQGEEASFSSSDMLANFTGLLDLIGLSLQESTYLLEHIDLSRVPSDPNVMNVITAMRSVVSQHESEFRHARGKLNELKHLHDTEVKEFSSTKWTDDKLAALIPVLSASYTADEHRSHKLKAQYETAKAKRDVDLARVDEIRRTCQLKIVELKSLPSDSWVLQTNLKFHDALAQQRQRLADVEHSVAALQAEKDFGLQMIEELTGMMNSSIQYFHDIQEQSRILASFNASLEKNLSFRTHIQNEIHKSISIREESVRQLVAIHKFMQSLVKRQQQNSLLTPTIITPTVPPNPLQYERDPLVHRAWDEYKEPVVEVQPQQTQQPVAPQQPPPQQQNQYPHQQSQYPQQQPHVIHVVGASTAPAAEAKKASAPPGSPGKKSHDGSHSRTHSPHAHGSRNHSHHRRHSSAGQIGSASCETLKRLANADLLHILSSSYQANRGSPPRGHNLWQDLHDRATRQSEVAKVTLDALEKMRTSEPVQPTVPEPDPREAAKRAAELLDLAYGKQTGARKPASGAAAKSPGKQGRRTSIIALLPGDYPRDKDDGQGKNAGGASIVDAVRGSLYRMLGVQRRTDQPGHPTAQTSSASLDASAQGGHHAQHPAGSARNPYVTISSSRKSSYATAMEMPSRRVSMANNVPRIVIQQSADDTGSVIEFTDSEIAAAAAEAENGEPDNDDQPQVIEVIPVQLPPQQHQHQHRNQSAGQSTAVEVPLSEADYMISRLLKENARLRSQFIEIRKDAATKELEKVRQVLDIVKEQEVRIKHLEKKGTTAARPAMTPIPAAVHAPQRLGKGKKPVQETPAGASEPDRLAILASWLHDQEQHNHLHSCTDPYAHQSDSSSSYPTTVTTTTTTTSSSDVPLDDHHRHGHYKGHGYSHRVTFENPVETSGESPSRRSRRPVDHGHESHRHRHHHHRSRSGGDQPSQQQQGSQPPTSQFKPVYIDPMSSGPSFYNPQQPSFHHRHPLSICRRHRHRSSAARAPPTLMTPPQGPLPTIVPSCSDALRLTSRRNPSGRPRRRHSRPRTVWLHRRHTAQRLPGVFASDSGLGGVSTREPSYDDVTKTAKKGGRVASGGGPSRMLQRSKASVSLEEASAGVAFMKLDNDRMVHSIATLDNIR
ncbi:BRO1-like domain-containing protein [Entophlyctis helioformis]|nr:BRO1-like domain-containing protein [Entophlyctis helioformis]